jgi:hypothetical protein
MAFLHGLRDFMNILYKLKRLDWPSRYTDIAQSTGMMMEAVRTFETSVNNHFTRQYIPEDNSEHHTRRRANLKSHKVTGYQ